jgi:O-antigen ligase
LAAAAVAVPLVCGPWFSDGYDVPKIAAAAILVSCGVAAMLRGGRLFRLRSRLDRPLGVFCALAILSAFVSIEPDLSWFGDRQELVFSLQGLAGCVIAFYLGCAEGPGRRARLIAWSVAGSLPVSAFALAQAGGWQPLIWKSGFASMTWAPSLFGSRAVSTFGSPVFLGAYLALIAPPALHLLLNRKSSPPSRGLGLVALLALAPALALTGSRGAWLAAAAGCAVAAKAHVSSQAAPRRRLGFWALGLAAGALVLALLGAHARAKASSSASDSLRAGIWRCAVEAWKDHPWLGSGVGTFTVEYSLHKGAPLARLGAVEGYPRSAHNDWLEVLATMGVAGLAAFLWLNAAILRSALDAARCDQDGAAAALGGALLSVAILAKFDPPGFTAAWLASAFAGCLCALPDGEPRRSAVGAPLALLAAAWFVWSVCLRTEADRQDLLGRLARAAGRPQQAARNYEAAVRLRPGFITYSNDLDNLLWDVAAASGSARQRELLDRAAEAALQGLRSRPLDPQFYRLLALAEMRRAQWGGQDRLRQAGRALETAEALDPDFDGTAQLRQRWNALSAEGHR